ncbi:hypothetical protein [Actinomadura sp. HBU206391]|uniref:hypothetical protein n=1 Tax=Actinomadura sp. HBU206391 TaxID=2731692 RepID=UPI0021C63DB7|nr:hypothetical protein [Actinomadura sp. HBU206391]
MALGPASPGCATSSTASSAGTAAEHLQSITVTSGNSPKGRPARPLGRRSGLGVANGRQKVISTSASSAPRSRLHPTLPGDGCVLSTTDLEMGATVVDWLFMIGLAGIGAALILGIGIRIAAAAGALLMVMMWSAVLPPANNLFMDDHLIYALLIIGLALTSAGDTLGLGRRWSSTSLVRSRPILK